VERLSVPRSLTVVIPALNEEQAIGGTISRCLDVREQIKDIAGLNGIEIIVVSDGSTDRTVEIAQGFPEINVIIFERNRGYGAAIKEGFSKGTGSLLGFLDADGTCDPLYFGDMCRSIIEEHADIVLGSRLGSKSSMPPVRRIGNRFYALLLGFLTGRSVTDSASGMRVLKKEAFIDVSPLPDGLHFTPSMSARALIDGLSIVEIPMEYAERIGRSKLHVVADGVRFLQTIFSGILCYRPDRLFLQGFTACLLGVILMGAHPVEFYWHNRMVEEWMIYRFIACFLLGSSGFMLLCATALSHHMASLGPKSRRTDSFWAELIAGLFKGKVLYAFCGINILISLLLYFPGIIEYFTTRTCTLHWSRVLVGTFFILTAFQTMITAILIELVKIWEGQKNRLSGT